MKFYNKIIKSFILSLVIVMLFSTVVLASEKDKGMDMDEGIEVKVEGINVELSFTSGKALTGNGDIMITLHDDDDKPITDALVTAIAEMDKSSMDPKMEDSKPIAIEFKKDDEEGQYMGEVDFTDEGKWIVKVTINAQGQVKNLDFNVDVEEPDDHEADSGANWGVIGGFLGLMALIIIIAGIKKKKSMKVTNA